MNGKLCYSINGGNCMNLLDEMNNFLSDLAVFYRKLQNYHWNIKGNDFFVIHEKLERYYVKRERSTTMGIRSSSPVYRLVISLIMRSRVKYRTLSVMRSIPMK